MKGGTKDTIRRRNGDQKERMKEMTLMQWDEDKVWKCKTFCMFIFFSTLV